MSDARKLLCQARFLDCVYLSVLPSEFTIPQAGAIIGKNPKNHIIAMRKRGLVTCIKQGRRGSGGAGLWAITDRGRDMAKAAVELWCELG